MSASKDLARAIERTLARYLSWREEAAPAPSVWDLAGGRLCWHVVLQGVAEPDIDVEIRRDALVVRAAVGAGAVAMAVLPAPAPYDPRRAEIAFRASVLRVRIAPGGG